MKFNKLAKLLPLIAMIVAIPAVAANQYSNKNDLHQSTTGNVAEGKRGNHLNDLNLTPEQKSKMQQIWTSTRTQMNEVLTPEQRQQLTDSKGQARRGKWKSLNLTADQQARLKAIRQAKREQMNAILTPEQQAKWKAHHNGKRHRNM
jgi:periplasmic protein CpxP/Spy